MTSGHNGFSAPFRVIDLGEDKFLNFSPNSVGTKESLTLNLNTNKNEHLRDSNNLNKLARNKKRNRININGMSKSPPRNSVEENKRLNGNNHFNSSKFRVKNRKPFSAMENPFGLDNDDIMDFLDQLSDPVNPKQVRIDNLGENDLKHQRTGFGFGIFDQPETNMKPIETDQFGNDPFSSSLNDSNIIGNQFQMDEFPLFDFNGTHNLRPQEMFQSQHIFRQQDISRPGFNLPDMQKIDNKTATFIFVLLSSLIDPTNLNGLRNEVSPANFNERPILPNFDSFSSEINSDLPHDAYPLSFDSLPLNPGSLTPFRRQQSGRNRQRIELQTSVDPSLSSFTSSGPLSNHDFILSLPPAPSVPRHLQDSDNLSPIMRFFHEIAPSFSRRRGCRKRIEPNCFHSYLGFCLGLNDNGIQPFDLESLIEADSEINAKHAEVTEQSADNLVSLLTHDQEDNFGYSFFHPSTYDTTHWIGPEGYICPSNVIYSRPIQAQNAKGEWKIIVNDGHLYTQTLRMEICLYPKTPCRLIASCFKSQCLQKYSYHRLLSYDPCQPSKGLYVDMFRLPSSCSCYAPAFYGFDNLEHILQEN